MMYDIALVRANLALSGKSAKFLPQTLIEPLMLTTGIFFLKAYQRVSFVYKVKVSEVIAEKKVLNIFCSNCAENPSTI